MGFDYKQAVDKAKKILVQTKEKTDLVTVKWREFVDALADAYKEGWDDAAAKIRPGAVEKDDEKKLQFGDLQVGDCFIGFPAPGDNSGHGGYLGSSNLFRKMEMKSSEEKAPVESGSAMDPRGITCHFPYKMAVLRVVVGDMPKH
jgi:hypothetical protein